MLAASNRKPPDRNAELVGRDWKFIRLAPLKLRSPLHAGRLDRHRKCAFVAFVQLWTGDSVLDVRRIRVDQLQLARAEELKSVVKVMART